MEVLSQFFLPLKEECACILLKPSPLLRERGERSQLLMLAWLVLVQDTPPPFCSIRRKGERDEERRRRVLCLQRRRKRHEFSSSFCCKETRQESIHSPTSYTCRSSSNHFNKLFIFCRQLIWDRSLSFASLDVQCHHRQDSFYHFVCNGSQNGFSSDTAVIITGNSKKKRHQGKKFKTSFICQKRVSGRDGNRSDSFSLS